ADGRRQALGGGILLLPRHADHGGSLRLRPHEEPRHIVGRRPAGDRGRLRGRLFRGRHRRALSARLRLAPRLSPVRLVAADRRRARAFGALYLGLERFTAIASSPTLASVTWGPPPVTPPHKGRAIAYGIWSDILL